MISVSSVAVLVAPALALGGWLRAPRGTVRALFRTAPTRRIDLELALFFVAYWLALGPLAVEVDDFLFRELMRRHMLSIMDPPFTILVLQACLTAPFVEELVFRGLLLELPVRRRWRIAISCALFACAHGWVVSAGLMGVLLCVVRFEAGGLWLPMAIHALRNLIGVLSIHYSRENFLDESSGPAWIAAMIALAAGFVAWRRKPDAPRWRRAFQDPPRGFSAHVQSSNSGSSGMGM